MKLGTHMQILNTNAPAKFQGHPPIITPFTPHMFSVQDVASTCSSELKHYSGDVTRAHRNNQSDRITHTAFCTL